MTIWIARDRANEYRLMAFETNPTTDDLRRADKHAGERRKWEIFRCIVHPTAAGERKRKGWADAAKTLEKAK